MVQRLPTGYVFDPADPRAPSDEQWDAMTPAERRRVVDMLPEQPDVAFLPPAEGDMHRRASMDAQTTLDSFFRRDRRKIYISGNLAIYYPNERVFAPDVIAVLDVDLHDRQSWVVRTEGKGIDFAMEIHVAGDRVKDIKSNVERYARLGIHEYFVLDRGRLSLRGYRLDPARPHTYLPIVPQGGRFASGVLGLDLMIEGGGLRFYQTTAPLLDAEERIDRLAAAFNDALERVTNAEERATNLERQLDEQRTEFEQRVRALEEEIERLKRDRGQA
jgi:Putative restriction endonuclease